MQTLIAVRDEVVWFASRMEAKLRKNDHKSHWSYLSVGQLRRRLAQEFAELKRAIDREASAAEIIDEAADVANFAMMIADHMKEAAEEPSDV